MKEKISTVVIILLFVLFCLFLCKINSQNEILDVKTPAMLVVDLNNNHIADDGETICIPDITSYTSNLSLYQDEIKNLTFSDGIAVGYLADNYAQKTLAGKFVKVKFTGKQSSQCKFANVFIDNRNYSDILKSSGFAIINEKFSDSNKSADIISKAKKLKLVIYNHKSDKYHKLDCKFGKIAHDAVILETKDLSKTAKPCKYCHITEKKSAKHKNISKVPDILSNGNIKIIMTDFTKILKPDNSCSHQVCRQLTELVDSAERTIDIALYGWTDIPKLRQAIINAQNRGVVIRAVYDTKTSSNNYYPQTEDLIKIIKNNRSDEIAGSTKLTNSLMHNKYIVFDNKTVYTGSMNFSLTGLSGFNQNNVVIINSPEIAKMYTADFNQMYSGKSHSLKSKSSNRSIVLSDGTRLSIYFSPQDKGITNAVIPQINNAKQYIYIPAFLITHKPLTNALISAKQRGVDVRIILDATSVGLRNSSTKQLRNAGVPVKIENYAGKMHSKTMIIDDKYVISGSANFSNSGENKNDENQILIENEKIAKFYKEFFLYMWTAIPDKYLKFNPPPESKDSTGSCSDGIDNDYDGKFDSADEGCR